MKKRNKIKDFFKKQKILSKVLFKSKYFWLLLLILVGVGFTIVFSKVFLNSDIGLAIGSGIFGSAAVAFVIEILMDVRKKKIKNDIFSDIKRLVKQILEYEIFNFSKYCNMYSQNKTENKIVRKEEKIENVLTILKCYLDKIRDYVKDEHNVKVFSEEWLEQENIKNNLLCLKISILYEKLLEEIEKVIENKDFYISYEIINENELDNFILLKEILKDIIRCQDSLKDYGIRDNIVDSKNNFFDHIQNIFKTLKISNNEIIRIIQ